MEWVMCIALLIVCTVALLQGRHGTAMTRGQALLYGSIFWVGFVLVVLRAGLNWEHYRRYGLPVVTPITPRFFPNAFENAFVYELGEIAMMNSVWLSVFPLGNLASSGEFRERNCLAVRWEHHIRISSK
jgi:hypothetical protein